MAKEMKEVEVASINFRLFLNKVLELGAKGATLPDTFPCFKAQVSRVKLEVPESVVVEESAIVRVVPKEKKAEVKFSTEVVKDELPVAKDGEKLTRAQLEDLSLKDLREVTGITSGKNKQVIIDEYLAEGDTPEQNKSEEKPSEE